MTPDYYYYLQSDTYKVDGTDDQSDFSETLVSGDQTTTLENRGPERGRDLPKVTQQVEEMGRTGIQVP